MRDTQQQSFSATILLQRDEEGHHMQKNSVIDLVYNHTITLECELKVVSRMLSTKRPTAVFARTAVTI